jgi:hypothetical protein
VSIDISVLWLEKSFICYCAVMSSRSLIIYVVCVCVFVQVCGASYAYCSVHVHHILLCSHAMFYNDGFLVR